MTVPISYWIYFTILILFLLFIDLWVLHKKPRAISFKEACFTSLGWISIALCFNVWVYFAMGYQAGIDFFAGYLLEKSLSIDNLFIFILIFSFFKVATEDKYRILFFGIISAIVMRALLIFGGLALIRNFNGIFIMFGLFLIFTGYKLAVQTKEEFHPEKSYIYRLFKYAFPQISKNLMVLVMIEITDLIFALDSVPAIFGITLDPFIVFTSNIFAILGLRSLFFALEPFMNRFHLLHFALSAILILIGIKIFLHDWILIPTWVTLSLMLGIIVSAIAGSVLMPIEKNQEK
jgi:tellurite resistance protein TerC